MIRLGVIGYGVRIAGLVELLHKIEPALKVAAVIDPDEAGARSRLDACDRKGVKFHSSLDRMVRDAKLDALMIGARCNLHAPYAIQCAKYRLPLFLEKPVAISMEQAASLEKAFRSGKCPVVVSFPLRVSPLCRKAREIIEAGATGAPVHINAVNYVPYGTIYWEQGYRDYKITGGLFLQKATHDLDYMSYLMGEPVVKVAAMAVYGRVFGGARKPAGLVCSKCSDKGSCLESPENRRRNGSRPGNEGDHPCLFGEDCGTEKTGTNEDCSSALLEFASGAQGVYTQVFFSGQGAARRGATVSGYMGTVDFDWYRNDIKVAHHHSTFSETIQSSGGAGHFGGDVELARDFIGIIKGECQSRATVQMGIQSACCCLAARESARTGRTVKVQHLC